MLKVSDSLACALLLQKKPFLIELMPGPGMVKNDHDCVIGMGLLRKCG